MLKPHEEGLTFSLTVYEMLQMNSTMFSNFTIDKAEYIAKVTDLKDPFQTDWKHFTSQLSTIESDNDYIGKQLIMTQAIEELMFKGRDQVQITFFYVDLAFPGNKAVHKYFGKDRYEAARKVPRKLVDLMLKCSKAAEKAEYKNVLLSKGLNSTLVDELMATSTKLKEKTDERDEYMSNRTNVTQERTKLLNKIWQCMSAVNTASKLVFKTDYAKQQQYLLYRPKPKSKDDVTADSVAS